MVLTALLDGQICEDFALSQLDKRLLKDLVPLALDDSILRMSLLALAARHLVNTRQESNRVRLVISSEDTKAEREALGFKHHAIMALSDALRDPAERGRDTTIASVVVLILLDLLESGSSGWHHHLEGAKGLLSLSQSRTGITPTVYQEPPRLEQDLRSFLMERIYLSVASDLFPSPPG
ncbi:hypothetical protein IMZ48_49190 [Candidatus Bathyarchaeota archaeon]|nr:hypothetical protein [Candidatus Bathyarchaeota archaeon]